MEPDPHQRLRLIRDLTHANLNGLHRGEHCQLKLTEQKLLLDPLRETWVEG